MKRSFLGAYTMTTMLLAGYSTVFAATTSGPSTAPVLNGVSTTPPGETSSMPIAITPFATTPPDMYWNLSADPYNGSFQDVSNATGIYTNYYFSPNAAGEISMNDDVISDGGSPTNYNLYLWDYTTGQEIYGATIPLGSNSFEWTGLNPNDFYYIEWKANGNYNYIGGTFSVHY
ncbi:hypothetical protein SAMN04489725_13111 [Alicyclobacillus hesperidum]|uniref:Uncharacterized protein n=1 Tax=Alicyclobacillus hesperidum TaxID=89784 RepID=A0A1H2YCD8_9BACL|nr:hypothetical protein [Alicyclobacillus hesperidum]SDX02189.1 hypothetical protein SAMN04489725_13111 [Alicyclobacillus hesperidum]